MIHLIGFRNVRICSGVIMMNEDEIKAYLLVKEE